MTSGSGARLRCVGVVAPGGARRDGARDGAELRPVVGGSSAWASPSAASGIRCSDIFGALPFIYGTVVSSPARARARGADLARHRHLPVGAGALLAAGPARVSGGAPGGRAERGLRPVGDLRARAVAARHAFSPGWPVRSGFLPFFQGPTTRLRHARGRHHARDHDHADHLLGRRERCCARCRTPCARARSAWARTRWEAVRWRCCRTRGRVWSAPSSSASVARWVRPWRSRW